MLSVIAAQNRNSPAQVVLKCARRLIDGTQCFHCDRLENVMSLQRSIMIIIIVRRRGTCVWRGHSAARRQHCQRSRGLFATPTETGARQHHWLLASRGHLKPLPRLKTVPWGRWWYRYRLKITLVSSFLLPPPKQVVFSLLLVSFLLTRLLKSAEPISVKLERL